MYDDGQIEGKENGHIYRSQKLHCHTIALHILSYSGDLNLDCILYLYVASGIGFVLQRLIMVAWRARYSVPHWTLDWTIH